MNRQEISLLIDQLKVVFDIVRLVDVTRTTQCSIGSNGEIIREPYRCYAVWRKDRRCENCISSKALAQKSQVAKYEFVDNEVYYVLSKYIELDDEPYALEMVTKVTDETLFDAYGKNEFVDTITNLNSRLYTDSLTGTYNRRYYDEQVKGMIHMVDGFALVDVDDFKNVNDMYGHEVGDLALCRIGEILMSRTRRVDTVIRYGGDEFFIVFNEIPADVLKSRIRDIKDAVESVSFEEYPELKLSVSIGAIHNSGVMKDILGKADQAMYKAKKEKNKVCFIEGDC